MITVFTLQVTGLGEKIRKSREALGLSQKELGEKLGLTGGRISEWECDREGRNTIPIERLLELEAIFGCSLLDRFELVQRFVKNLSNES
ncbi:helix-turn-helix domain protein [Stanieria cyanosphaera PCC 7437]|uniref:Helix-turn-helix domain protein n=1 Tax=Stanieria cyanosphaera (strain ATCC 29371 / PCC 7437) TaxID=111780 RepID=K9XS68_STAC7|nr:helix-turn-helix transcriptional regulator [Stanieria cyanosphaera]AFZ35378.1 helix-turn-helix domain protein [Stanieria cyanosphaera PCC 7437]